MVKAFRDVVRWHKFLSNLFEDRLTIARDLLHESGSIFVQIGDENVHRVRALLDEDFGEENNIAQIAVLKTTGVMATSSGLHGAVDYLLWYGKTKAIKFNELITERSEANSSSFNKYINSAGLVFSRSEVSHEDQDQLEKFRFADLLKAGPGAKYEFCMRNILAWREMVGHQARKHEALVKANRVKRSGKFVYFVSKENDFPVSGFQTCG